MVSHFIDIIVLTWNQKEVTKKFISSFFASTHVPCRLIIIDNGSTDGTQEFLSILAGNDSVKVTVVLNSENKGFVEGMNQGIRLSEAPFVCLANNDLEFTRGWLEEIISVFEANPRIGIVNPNSNNLGERPQDKEPTGVFADKLRREFKGVFVEMPFCIGFCMVIRRQVIEALGGLSPEFSPFFFEDTDYSLKALRAGFLVGMAKGAYVWHQEHASVNGLGEQKEAYFSASRKVFLKKWGRILRIMFVVKSAQEIDGILPGAIALARSGNFVWIAARGVTIAASEIFRQRHLTEHSGVKLVPFSSVVSLGWKILVKKKRYDVLITTDPFIRTVAVSRGAEVLNAFDAQAIEKIKVKRR